jgi:hypothetical protein
MKVNSRDHHLKIIYHQKFLEETHFQHIPLVEDLHLPEVQAEFNSS